MPEGDRLQLRSTVTTHQARHELVHPTPPRCATDPFSRPIDQATDHPYIKHRTPNTTHHYAKITPNTLSKAYSEAGYFARNVRAIEVLVDRDAVTSGAAAAGEPWQHYDLGHGWCTYSFFEQCPHRMACARCDFYTPKDSTKAQLLEAAATSSACSPASRSPTTNAPPSTTGTPPSPHCSIGSPTYPLPLDPPRVNSARLRPRPCCRSCRSEPGNRRELDNFDSTE